MNITIYADKGTSPETCGQTENFFRKVYGVSCSVSPLKACDVQEENWPETTDIFVMPGGATTPVRNTLKKSGMERIRTFVKNGGKYLGLCAGGYFGARDIEFAVGDLTHERIARQQLGFFNGVASGPVYDGFEYNSTSGVRAVPIQTSHGTVFSVYSNGGGTFENADALTDTHILARYAERGGLPAVILCSYGKGAALLSGVHFEYDAYDLEKNDSNFSINVLNELKAHHKTRLSFAKKTMDALMNA